MFPFILLILAFLAPAPQPKVILVTIDGVMWQDIYSSNARLIVPNLYLDFVQQGIAVGKMSPMVATGPMHISLPSYLEITRGHPSKDCQRNDCYPVIDRSIFQLFSSSALFTSWKNIQRTVPAHANVYTDQSPPYRWDANTIGVADDYLKTHTPEFLWVALGDTDEWAHTNDRAHYLAALTAADTYIRSLVVRYPNATIIVTTDHGRSSNFRDHGIDSGSGRVWLMMRGPSVPHKGLVAANHLSLSNIYDTISEIQTGIHSDNSILSRIQ